MAVFSIIIPVYNAEKTLNRCLDSLIRQSFRDFEAILIDDGSKDSSLGICRQYEERDSRFHVLFQENAGPSKARNCGLEKACGTWICFADSDDYIRDDYFEKLYEIVSPEKSDAVFFGYTAIAGDGTAIKTFIPQIHEPGCLKAVEELSKKDMFGYTWIKVFRRALIKDVRFDESMTLFEDEVFTCSVLNNECSISVLNEPLYYHTVDLDGSLMKKTHHDYCILCDKVYRAWQQMLAKYAEKDSLLKNKAESFTNRCIYYGFERTVDTVPYFTDLSGTGFFSRNTAVHNNSLYRYIEKKNFLMIRVRKIVYKSKVGLSKLKHKMTGR